MDEKEKDTQNRQRYWKMNLRFITGLLIIWALVSYVFGILLAPLLNNIQLGQLPLGFWFAQQGSMIIFVILIFVYATRMDKIDSDYEVKE
jgi:putative solute:sodium symporter small subunit